MNHMRSVRLRSGLLRLFLIVLLLVLIGRIGYLQIVDGNRLSAMAKDNWTEVQRIEPIRGTIYDANEQKLAYTMPAFYLNLHPMMLKDKDPEYVAQKISELSNGVVPKDKLLSILSKTESDSWLTLQNYKFDQVTKDAIVKFLETYAKDSDESTAESDTGVYFWDTVKREYPLGDFASHIVGFTTGSGDPNSPVQGSGGIEQQYNTLLSGTPGQEKFLKDRDGNPLPFGQQLYQAPVEGKDLVLTIDDTIQRFCEQALDGVVKTLAPKEASIIVTNPKTGEILAMANRPSYNPNNFAAASPDALYRNWAVSATFEPGSTFKIVTLTAALAENKISTADRFTTGAISVPGATIHDWNGSGWGAIDYKWAMIHSSNVAMVQIGQKLGAKLLYNYIDQFGFNQPTHIDLPGESNSILFDPNNIRPVNLATTTFGQGIAVTPMQQIAAVGAVANGGSLMKPYLVKEIRDPSTGETVQSFKPTVVRKIATPQVMNTVSNVMVEDVSQDTNKTDYIPGYQVAGKTGTAQIPQPNGGYYPDRYVGSFIGFAPAKDPAIEIYVTVDTPDPSKNIYYGSQVAAPAAKEVLQKTLAYLRIPADQTQQTVKPASLDPAHQYAVIPDLKDQTVNQATSTAKGLGYSLQVIGSGKTIMKQWPEANQQYVVGTRMIALTDITNLKGNLTMPDLTGISMREVSEILSLLHVQLTPSGSGFAISQSIVPGATLTSGSNVKIKFAPKPG